MATRAQTRYFVLGLFAGSAAVAFVLNALAAALADAGLPAGVRAGGAVAGALALVAVRAVRPGLLPQNRRQVPDWVTGTHPAGFAIFGAEMGTGMRTFSPTVLPHVLAFAVLALGRPGVAVAATVGFAGGRALMVPLYRLRTRHGRPYSFAVPRPVELAVALAMVAFVAWWASTTG